MEAVYDTVGGFFRNAPEAALFLSIGLGYLTGKLSFGRFKLGGVTGTLLIALIVSLFGVEINDSVKNIFLVLFLFGAGYTTGPHFFKYLDRKSLREVLLAGITAVSGFLSVLVCAKIFLFDKGTAAGIAAGGLTRMSILGSAEYALRSTGLQGDALTRMTANMMSAYSVTYIFGTLTAVIVCVHVVPRFMGRTIRSDAVRAEAMAHKGILLGNWEEQNVPELEGRVFEIGRCAGKTVRKFEEAFKAAPVTIERIKRDGRFLPVTTATKLIEEDIVLVVGRHSSIEAAAQYLGREHPHEPGMDMVISAKEVAFTNDTCTGRSIKDLKDNTPVNMRHGLYIMSVTRGGSELPLSMSTVIKHGDIVKFYGAEQDINRAVAVAGYPVFTVERVDMVCVGLGIVTGCLIGVIGFRLGAFSTTLSFGTGALISGLIFGRVRMGAVKKSILPLSVSYLLMDLGLAGFVAAVGLNYGMATVSALMNNGLPVLIAGLFVAVAPLLTAMAAGKYLLGYDNAAAFAGALSGARSAGPAFGEVRNKADNSAPNAPFALAYITANILLTLLGPLVVLWV